MNKRIICKDTEETKKLAEEFASILKDEDIVLFYGDLGAGKTFFVRSVCRLLGVKSDNVLSPTFSIVKTYKVKDSHIHHFDFYRMGKNVGAEFFEFEDYLQEKNIIFVEWADRIKKTSFPGRVISITINIKGETEREFIIDPWES
ncbi:MAG: tRNA (adenosine(37)-N6)-threonylcarbamoyltransferase complex ATPase subunit type 1 TsaE [Candidatus Aureabacteria bacterium]|nr:tRNA (adenosine(37)-N6)-threonylcarbamoyltransferase complex ATPase subunit type 1 TsaE [Candidatus Auribacterota bacterium]